MNSNAPINIEFARVGEYAAYSERNAAALSGFGTRSRHFPGVETATQGYPPVRPRFAGHSTRSPVTAEADGIQREIWVDQLRGQMSRSHPFGSMLHELPHRIPPRADLVEVKLDAGDLAQLVSFVHLLHTESSLLKVRGPFLLKVSALATQAESIVTLDEDDVEYAYQVSLFWKELGSLNQFIGNSGSISEVVTELLTARFQFIGKDTPKSAMVALYKALTLVAESREINEDLVDSMVEALETGEIDTLVIDALRDNHE